MKKQRLLTMIVLVCFSLIFLSGCGTNPNMPESKSVKSLTTESLSLLDQMARSDSYLSTYTSLGDKDQTSSILAKIRSVADLTKPTDVYCIDVNEEKLIPLVLGTTSDLPTDKKKYQEDKVNLSIASLINGKQGTDYMFIHTALHAKSGGFCSETKEGSVMLNVYETGYPVLSVVHPLNDGYVEVSSTILFIDATSENSEAEIEEMLSSYSFIESVQK